MEKKIVGIITMHRVMNYGSVLQAYALQEAVKKNGYDVEIIDYVYPNKYHENFKENKSIFYKFVRIIYRFLRKLYFIFLYKGDKSIKVNRFVNKYLNLSSTKYKSPISISNNPPLYDIYMTGSDQVWNPAFTYADTIFMLSFVNNNAKKISFAPSITQESIPSEYKKIYIDNISKYSYLSVRDESSARDLQKILNKDVLTVCDPVLLLEEDDYANIISSSKLELSEKYILIYILDYMFNPYPKVLTLIEKVKSMYKLPIYFIWGKKSYAKQCNADIFISEPTVADFLKLVKNADIIITTSYHGTAFSIIFRKQFLSIINNSSTDTRIKDLLKNTELIDNCININDSFNKYNIIDYKSVEYKIMDYINQSRNFLANALAGK